MSDAKPPITNKVNVQLAQVGIAKNSSPSEQWRQANQRFLLARANGHEFVDSINSSIDLADLSRQPRSLA